MSDLLRGKIISDYIDCALWADLRDHDGESLDGYSVDDIAPATVQAMRDDCAAFFWSQRALIRQALAQRDRSHLAHDLWLSRNGHGAGFFDRGREPFWDELQRAARVEGSRDLYVGDDWQVHQS